MGRKKPSKKLRGMAGAADNNIFRMLSPLGRDFRSLADLTLTDLRGQFTSVVRCLGWRSNPGGLGFDHFTVHAHMTSLYHKGVCNSAHEERNILNKNVRLSFVNLCIFIGQYYSRK